jgi:predicted RNase H-like nuclease (RuvC/YqgF family)
MSSDEFEALIIELNTTVAAQAREMRAVVRERDELAAECRAFKSQQHHRTSSDGQCRAAELQVTELKAQLQQASERLSKMEAAAFRTMQAEKALADARSQVEFIMMIRVAACNSF